MEKLTDDLEKTESPKEQEQVEEVQEIKSQLTLMGLEELEKTSEKKDLVLKSPEFKVETLLDVDNKRVEAYKLPISFGGIGEKQPNKDIISLDGVEISSLGQSLYNFKYVRESGTGSRRIYLKSRECKIILEGIIYGNGSIGMTKLLAYSVSKDLSFKRAMEVYTFMQKALAGNQVAVKGENLNLEITIPQQYEQLKVLKVVEVLYKYYSVAKEMGLNQSEKVETILKNAVQINELASLMRGQTTETMVRLEGETDGKLAEAKSLKLILEKSVRIKKFHMDYIKEVVITDFVLENKESDVKMSTSWKKAYLTYKKVLDKSTQL